MQEALAIADTLLRPTGCIYISGMTLFQHRQLAVTLLNHEGLAIPTCS